MLFLGCLFDRSLENEILKKTDGIISNAANTFQWNVIDGLIENKITPKIINVLPVGCFPKKYKQLFLDDRNWQYKNCECCEIGSINIPIFKQYFRYRKILKQIKKSDDYNILIYSTYMPFLKAVYKLNNKFNITLIVTDLPEYYDLANTSKLKHIIRRLYNIKIDKYLNRINKYVLLTEQMRDKLEIYNKPYIIVEGICNRDDHITKDNYTDNNKKIILYTGTLNYKYGIRNLLDAFDLIENEDYELRICGNGEAKNEIIERMKKNQRIKFYGYLNKNEIKKMQQKCTALINPRMNDEEYTKYSFPSKTMEYLQSGKPVIMYKLDGIPSEYDDYLNYVNGKNTVDLKNKIIEVCSKDTMELNKYGKKASEWVAREKNCSVQTKRIIELMRL